MELGLTMMRLRSSDLQKKSGNGEEPSPHFDGRSFTRVGERTDVVCVKRSDLVVVVPLESVTVPTSGLWG